MGVAVLAVSGPTVEARSSAASADNSGWLSAQVVHVENAGHSVQGDAPVELARLIDRFTATNSTNSTQ